MHPSATSGAASISPTPLITVVIPARYASSRLPGKPLAVIGGQTMIERVYRRASSARGVSRAVVATDDYRIAEAVRAFGGEAFMTSQAHQTGTDRIAEVAPRLQAELVVNVQGDEPLVAPEAIEEAIAPVLADRSIVMGTLGTLLDESRDLANPHVVKVLVDALGFAIGFSRAGVLSGSQGAPPEGSILKHVGIYVYRREFLIALAALPRTPLEKAESLEQLRALEHGYRIKVTRTRHQCVSVDTPEDLERVRKLVASGRFR